jgi:two-component system response regulator FixJ
LKTSNAVVYLVDDDDAVRESLTACLEAYGFTVEAFTSGEAFQRRAVAGLIGCLILDLQLPQQNGLDILHWLRRTLHSALPVLLISGHGDPAILAAAYRAGIDGYIEKPFQAPVLAEMIWAIFDECQTNADPA